MVLLSNSSRTVVFFDETYPHYCARESLERLVPGSFELVDAAHLAGRLREGDCSLFVSFHGPYFPKACWLDILDFLERGGNLAIFGGMPFTRPVAEPGQIEPEQDAYTRQLYLGPFARVASDAQALELVAAPHAPALEGCALTCAPDDPGIFWACYPKLTQAEDHPEDSGSAGPFDTLLQPLIYAQASGPRGRRRVATPAFLLDQRSGRFCGGRWLLSSWQPASEKEWLANADALQRLILLAAEGPTLLEARPALACYQPGESPSLLVSARTRGDLHVHLVVSAPQEAETVRSFELDFSASPVQQEKVLFLSALHQPGLYRIKGEYWLANGQALGFESGFWIWDEALVQSTRGKRLTAGRDAFYQGEELFFIFGTTYMDSLVQRKFLHLPNPARWDNDLAEIRASGVNLIRTGLWTAWRELVPVAGVANEAFLRALDAFILTVCKHNLQLIFTFFTFFPLLFEGENPWLDPRSLAGQRDFVALLAQRYARVELLFWDLINEPSFGDPAKIFSLRPLPHGDRFERRAFQRWLAEHHTLSELQMRWRQTPADLPDWQHVGLPEEKDFETSIRNVHVRSAFKVADYTRFSQDMFCQWADSMSEAIRAGGGRTLIGVGQDEAGARIAPQFYASAVDYTTTHPWWNIDDLLWDMLIDKTPDKPNLIQETGIMLLLGSDGRPWRSEQENAYLLERKFITGLIARGAGLIQWLWHTNAYMISDNENGIGLLRADGSAKPELATMEEFGRLVQALEGRMLEAPTSPDVWVVIPYAQWFARPAPAREGTQKAVRVLGYDLGILPQMVGEQQLAVLKSSQHHPRAIIVPAAQLLDQHAWSLLLDYVHQGGTLLVNGVIARDAYDFPCAPGLAEIRDEVCARPVARYEELLDSEGHRYALTFADEKISYVRKAHNHVYRYQHGAGLFVWCGLPLELASESAVLGAIYRQVLPQTPSSSETNPALLTARRELRAGTLILAVCETSSTQQITLDEGVQLVLEPGRAGAAILEHDGSVQTFGGLSSSR
jgi:hypothetical protein